MKETKFYIQKAICFLLTFCIVVATLLQNAYALSNSVTTEILLPSEALSDTAIVDYLRNTNKLGEFYKAQNAIKQNYDEQTAQYAARMLNESDISSSDVEEIRTKYNLLLPNESKNGIIDNGYMCVKKKAGRILGAWYFYYTVSDSAFIINAALIDYNDPLDKVTGTVTRYTLNDTSWVRQTQRAVEKNNVMNGVVDAWFVSKWAVKEKFEYDLVIVDNGVTNRFNNINKNNNYRYNFDAQPYNSFTANGGQRHHFVSQSALNSNGYNSNTAYCIRMMTADHRKTGSYGNTSYVNQESQMLKNRQYEALLQKEVNDLKSKQDCDGIAGTLQQKYNDEVVTCLFQYERLFGIR